MVMVVIPQRNALFFQHGLQAVDLLDEGIQLFAGRKIVPRNDVIRVANRLMEGERRFIIVYQIVQRRMRSRHAHPVFAQHSVHRVRAVAEKAREFNEFVADFRHFGDRVGEILLRDVAHGVHLQTIFHPVPPLALYFYRTQWALHIHDKHTTLLREIPAPNLPIFEKNVCAYR